MIEAYLRANKMFVDYNEVASFSHGCHESQLLFVAQNINTFAL